MILDYLKDNNLESEFFTAVVNVLEKSTIEDVKRWYARKSESQ